MGDESSDELELAGGVAYTIAVGAGAGHGAKSVAGVVDDDVRSVRNSPAEKSAARASSASTKTSSAGGRAAADFTCKGCLKRRPAETQVPGLQWERSCKRAYDSIARLVKKQGKEEWWSETKAVPKKLSAAIADYLRHCPDVNVGRGKSRGVWSIATYMETVKSVSMVERRDRGRFMWEEEYYEFAASVAGGMLRRDEAKERWAEWSKEDSGVLRETAGPAHSPLQLRVVTGVELDSVSQISRERALVCQDAPQKKVTNEQLSGMRGRVLSAHHEVGGLQAMDLSGAMVALAGAGVEPEGGAFSSGLNVTGMVHYDIESQLINRDNAAGGGPAAEAVVIAEEEEFDETEKRGTGGKRLNKKAKHYDASRRNTALQTSWTNSMAVVRKEGDTVLDNFKKLLAEYDTAENANYEFLKPTIKLLKARQEALSLVMAVPSATATVDELRERLKKYVDGFVQAGLAKDLASKGAAAGEARPPTDIAKAPPDPEVSQTRIVVRHRAAGCGCLRLMRLRGAGEGDLEDGALAQADLPRLAQHLQGHRTY